MRAGRSDVLYWVHAVGAIRQATRTGRLAAASTLKAAAEAGLFWMYNTKTAGTSSPVGTNRQGLVQPAFCRRAATTRTKKISQVLNSGRTNSAKNPGRNRVVARDSARTRAKLPRVQKKNRSRLTDPYRLLSGRSTTFSCSACTSNGFASVIIRYSDTRQDGADLTAEVSISRERPASRWGCKW